MTTLNSPLLTNKVDDSVHRLVSWLRWFAENRLNSYLNDSRKCIPPYLILEFGNKGLFGLNTPSTYNGLGLTNAGICTILEQLGAIDLSLSTLIINNNFLGIRPIVHFGSDFLRNKYLPELASGRALISFALSESAAGSNPLRIEGRGVIHENYCILNASKMWIGSASWSTLINTFVHVEDPNGKQHGITCYAVPSDTAGVQIGEELMTMGMRTMVQNKIYYRDAKLFREFLVGDVGSGMQVANDAMTYTRLAFAASFLGSMKRCMQLVHRYTSRRKISSTARLLENPITLQRLGAVIAMVDLVDASVMLTAAHLDSGHVLPREIYIVCKVAGSEFLWNTIDISIQALGGRGYLENNVLPQIMRDARVTRIFEGPTETLLAFMGSKLIKENENSEILRFMDLLVGDKIIVKNLREIQQLAKAIVARNTARLGEVSFALGEIVMWSLLVAILISYGVRFPSSSARWGIDKLSLKISRFKDARYTPVEVLSAGEFDTRVAQTCFAIGDLEQTALGEDVSIDPYLRIAVPDGH